jgi:hypothetical protein
VRVAIRSDVLGEAGDDTARILEGIQREICRT